MILFQKIKRFKTDSASFRFADDAGGAKGGKRLLSMLTAALLAAGSLAVPAAAEGTEGNVPAETAAVTDFASPGGAGTSGQNDLPEGETYRIPWVEYSYEDLYIGNPTPMQGRFFTTLWGGTTADLDVQTLLHGCSLVRWDPNLGRFRPNRSVISGLSVEDDQEGNRTYHIVLQKSLVYSDGTPVTASDYAYSILFQIDPAIAETGGNPRDFSYLLGVAEYLRGEAAAVRGIRVPDDLTLELTVRADELPFFYEMSRLNINPYPREVISPDVRVVDRGEGACLLPGLTADIIRRYVLDSYSGYLSHPSVTTGPYVLTGFDGKTADFSINPYYHGDENGVMPRIPRLHFTGADNVRMMEELGEGTFGLVNKVTWNPALEEGFLLVEREGRQYTMSLYPRNGMALVRFSPESMQVQDLAMRRAMALCLDRETLIRAYTGDYGVAVNGLYGIAQWTCLTLTTGAYPMTENADESEEQPEAAQPGEPSAAEAAEKEERAAWENLTERLNALNPYALNVAEAIRILEEDGWNLNLSGEPFVPGTDEVRCKMQPDGRLLSLELRGAIPQTNMMRASLEQYWLPYLREAGIKLTLEPVGMGVLAEIYTGAKTTAYDLIVVGEDFPTAFDPTAFFTLSESQQAALEAETNPDALLAACDRIAGLAREAGHTSNRELLLYMTRWMDMQEEINRALPIIPIYSNYYFDFYTRELQDYDIINHISWGEAVAGAVLGSAGVTDDPDTALLLPCIVTKLQQKIKFC